MVTRRIFIKTASMGVVGLGITPALMSFNLNNPGCRSFVLPRSSPENKEYLQRQF
jgi:hypothetical protein